MLNQLINRIQCASTQQWVVHIEDQPPVRATDYNRPMDLLSGFDPLANMIQGDWSLAGEKLTCSGGDYSRVELPVRPGDNYRISMRVTRKSGKEHVGMQLPLADGRSAVFLLDTHPHRGGYNGLIGLDGSSITRGAPAAVKGINLPLDVQQLLEVTIRQSKGNVHIVATLDGKPLFDWQGSSRRLTAASAYRISDPTRLALHVHKSRIEFRDVTLESH